MSLEKFLKECEARVCPCDFGERCDDFYKLFRIVKELKTEIARLNTENKRLKESSVENFRKALKERKKALNERGEK